MRCLERQGKATQHNLPKFLQTHDRSLARRRLPTAQLAGLESHIQYKATKAPQPKHHKQDKQVNSKLV